MEIKNDSNFVRDTMKRLNFARMSDDDIERWVDDKLKTHTVRDILVLIIKELRNDDQVLERILKYLL